VVFGIWDGTVAREDVADFADAVMGTSTAERRAALRG
jgi:hypothetical protein